MREIGEGQFGKVLLMKAKVSNSHVRAKQARYAVCLLLLLSQNIAGFSGKLPVAVKTLSSIEEEEVKKFLEEVELMKKFCHPQYCQSARYVCWDKQSF